MFSLTNLPKDQKQKPLMSFPLHKWVQCDTEAWVKHSREVTVVLHSKTRKHMKCRCMFRTQGFFVTIGEDILGATL